MLEVKNLTKLYKTKGGADVRALDDVSLKFPETGMVFLLGKSGSGKSTLLNVCGGLDSPTSGEVIVKGRSSKSFSQGDFDSYRNTFVGFIFQEYNVLNEFTVEDNIALALELQGKPKDKKSISRLLDQVDLSGLAKRKPNTLSGGQKQRIAIARALIKSPEIIMADEPTGALDSATGKQVFDTLKKLSHDKLVLVVSHDRDFAEQYGDRIIELKDGKVFSDITKTREKEQSVSQNITTIGDVLYIKKGASLNDGDFQQIKNLLANAEGDVIIAGNEKDVKAFKQVSRITDQGEKEVFRETDPKVNISKTYDPEESRFIRSKLPARHAMRIGVSGMKSKPFRLFFTVLLCTVAFVLFGLLSTMMFYNSEDTFKQTLMDSSLKTISLNKYYRVKEITYFNGEKEYEYISRWPTGFTQAQLEDYADQFGTNTFGGIDAYASIQIQNSSSGYWSEMINTFAYLSEANPLRENITGEYPSKKNEICISSYSAELLVNCKAYDKDGKLIDVSSVGELLGKTIILSGKFYTITGIFDCGPLPEKFESLKTSEDRKLQSELYTVLQDGLYQVAFLSQDQLVVLAEQNKNNNRLDNTSYYKTLAIASSEGGALVYPDYSSTQYQPYSEKPASQTVFWMDGELPSLGDGEAVISLNMFGNQMSRRYQQQIEALHMQEFIDEKELDRLYQKDELARTLSMGGIWKDNSETGKGELIPLTQEEKTSAVQTLLADVKKDGISLCFRLFNQETQSCQGDERQVTVVGLCDIPINEYNSEEKLLLSDGLSSALWNEQKENIEYYTEYETGYVAPEDACYTSIFLAYDHSGKQTQMYWDIYNNKEFSPDETILFLRSSFTDQLSMVDEMVSSMSKIFLYVGLAFAAFAILLFSNFIAASISQKKREIGILRAVGARSSDVFKIFFSESFVISVICLLLSIAGSFLLCQYINGELAEGIGASLLVFGPISVAVLLVVALITAVLATFFPVFKAAKKRPVESIRAL